MESCGEEGVGRVVRGEVWEGVCERRCSLGPLTTCMHTVMTYNVHSNHQN